MFEGSPDGSAVEPGVAVAGGIAGVQWRSSTVLPVRLVRHE